MHFSRVNIRSARKEKKCPFLGEVFRESGCYHQFKASSNKTGEMERALLEMVRERLGLAHSRVRIPQEQEKALEEAWMGAELAEEESAAQPAALTPGRTPITSSF